MQAVTASAWVAVNTRKIRGGRVAAGPFNSLSMESSRLKRAVLRPGLQCRLFRDGWVGHQHFVLSGGRTVSFVRLW
jgi:hypothetical protein